MHWNDIHKVNPYDNFDYHSYPQDLQGWGSTESNFKELIDKTKPSLIIEVGSWKGGSAIFMAEKIRELGLDCKILCIDTWLGAIEFLNDKNDEDRYISLAHKNGYPSVYYQFLANVCHKGYQDIIIPFPQTSELAARFLSLNSVQADMIFIDASHDIDDVKNDLNAYWPLVKKGGVLFGDDYDEHWPGVKLAVNDFCTSNELFVGFAGRQWTIKKSNEETIKSNVEYKYRDLKFLALQLEKDAFTYKCESFELRKQLNSMHEKVLGSAGAEQVLIEQVKKLESDKAAIQFKLDKALEANSLVELEKNKAEQDLSEIYSTQINKIDTLKAEREHINNDLVYQQEQNKILMQSKNDLEMLYQTACTELAMVEQRLRETVEERDIFRGRYINFSRKYTSLLRRHSWLKLIFGKGLK